MGCLIQRFMAHQWKLEARDMHANNTLAALIVRQREASDSVPGLHPTLGSRHGAVEHHYEKKVVARAIKYCTIHASFCMFIPSIFDFVIVIPNTC